jgi:hypothetical protein
MIPIDIIIFMRMDWNQVSLYLERTFNDNKQWTHRSDLPIDVPLQSQSLIQLCRMADYSAADRILVKPIKQSTFAYFQEQVWNNFTSHGSEQKHVTTASPQLQEEAAVNAAWSGYDNHTLSQKLATPDLGVSPSSRRNLKIKDHAVSPTYPR